jgi:TM2 domain-containing membrane protein YozV
MAMIYCRECGAKHSDKAAACPKCGYRSVCDGKSVLVYSLLALLFGMWGVHKFYAGRKTEGIVMLLMGTIGWVLIVPGIAVCIWAFVDFIIGLINLDNPKNIFIK